jgi:hypothetical protein
MPPVVAAASTFVKVLGSKGLISALFSTAVGQAILTVGSLALQVAFRPRIDFDDAAGQVQGQELRVRFQSDHPITVLVGRTATAGHCVFASSRGPSGDPTRYLTRVFILSDYECADVNRIWGDGDELTFSGDVTTGWRECTSHYQGEDGENRLRMRVYLGAEDQAADSDLDGQYSQITSDFRLRGKTYAIVECDYDPEYAFRAGEPQLLWEVDGAPCYDPREAGHDPDDASTWAFTENAALIAAQYYAGWKRAGKVILGAGWSRDRLPEADLIAAANECDEAVSLKAGGTIARYRASGPIYASRSHRSNITELLKAMDGEVDDTAGEVRLLPGVERAAVMEIKWADILAAETIELDPEFDPADGINRVLARYPDPDSLYQPLDLPARTDAAYVTEDGGEDLTLSTEFGLVPYAAQVQRITKRILERGRAQRRLSVTMRLKYIVLEKGDRVTLDADLRARLRLPETNWRVETRPAMTLEGDSALAIKLVLREHPDSVGDWTAATDELDEDSATITRPGSPTLTVPGLAVEAITIGASGFQYPSGRVTWTATSVAVRLIEIELREDGNNATRQQFSASPSSLQQTLGRLGANVDYQVRARVVTGTGRQAWSSWLDFTSGATDTATGVDWGGVTGSGKPDDNATVGADWSSNLLNRPTELTDGRVAVGLASNGDLARSIPGSIKTSSDILSRTGGGVFTGDLSATLGADWSANVSNRPTELTDGRITAALTVDGDIIRPIPEPVATSSDLLRKTGGGLFTGDLAATAGADWSTNLTSRPTELTDGRVSAALDSSGDLQNDARVRQVGGTTKRALGRALAVIEAQDGDSITFAEAFNEPPTIRILGGTGSTFDERIGTGSNIKHLQDYAAQNVTTTGFDVKAKIRGEATGTTARNDAVTTAGSGSDPDYVGDKSTADEAFDDNYTFSGTLTGTYTSSGFATATIELYTNDGGGWVKRASVNFLLPSASGGTSISEPWSRTINVDGLGQHGGKEFGIAIVPGGNISSADNSAGAVVYNSIASITEYSATPGSEVVFCYVFESDQTLE